MEDLEVILGIGAGAIAVMAGAMRAIRRVLRRLSYEEQSLN